jgi:L-fuconolactonase
MAVLRADHLPVHLASLLEGADVDGTVVVQARQTLEETHWLLNLADAHSFIRGVVGWVDLRSRDLSAQLERFAAHPKFCGVRHVLQDEPDDALMLRDDFLGGIAMLAQLGLTYDILIYPKHLPAARQLAERFPDQPFVLDHIAKPFIKDGKLSPWDRDIRLLAECPNVFCKISGMITEADWQHWAPADFHPYLEIALEVFGPERLMFGSDWPVCTVAGTYAQVVELVRGYFSGLSVREQADLYGETACRFYGISQE